ETGDRPVDDADDEDEERCGEADGDRDLAAHRGAREQVAAELVGGERMIEAEADVRLREVDAVRVVALQRRPDPRDLPEAGNEEAVEDHRDEDGPGGDSSAVPDVAIPGVAPQARLCDRRSRRRLLD